MSPRLLSRQDGKRTRSLRTNALAARRPARVRGSMPRPRARRCAPTVDRREPAVPRAYRRPATPLGQPILTTRRVDQRHGSLGHGMRVEAPRIPSSPAGAAFPTSGRSPAGIDLMNKGLLTPTWRPEAAVPLTAIVPNVAAKNALVFGFNRARLDRGGFSSSERRCAWHGA